MQINDCAQRRQESEAGRQAEGINPHKFGTNKSLVVPSPEGLTQHFLGAAAVGGAVFLSKGCLLVAPSRRSTGLPSCPHRTNLEPSVIELVTKGGTGSRVA